MLMWLFNFNAGSMIEFFGGEEINYEVTLIQCLILVFLDIFASFVLVHPTSLGSVVRSLSGIFHYYVGRTPRELFFPVEEKRISSRVRSCRKIWF